MCKAFRLPRVLLLAAVVVAVNRPAAAADKPPATDAGGIHDRMMAQYLAGQWDELSAELISDARATSALPPAQKTDVDYIRRALAESRPTWWKQVKAGQKLKFRPVVWTHPLSATFDPEAKYAGGLDFVNGVAFVTVTWNAKDMDNPAIEGELQFTKGEHVDVDLWAVLGTSETSVTIPPHFRLAMKEDAQLQLNRYLEFRGNVTGAYYATPRARRWAIWNGISGWSHEYDKQTTVMARRAVGLFFAAEVLGHPDTYPSVRWPEDPPAAGAESKMIWTFSEWVAGNNFTFGEDKALRDALKTFAAANSSEPKFRQSGGKISLSNGLWFSLDPIADNALAIARDAWAKAQIRKGRPPAKQ